MPARTLCKSVSRRHFLKSVAAVPPIQSTFEASRPLPQSGKLMAYVGTYTGAVGDGGNGKGIYIFEMDLRTGQLSRRELVAKTPSPSWMAIHPSKRYLYAANEVGDSRGRSGSVSAFAIDSPTGQLHSLNVVASEGAQPAYLSIDSTGKFAFVANYGSGSIAVISILPQGRLGSVVDVHRDRGAVGRPRATNAPVGSFAISGHDAPHAHMILPDPYNKFVLATDLGQDRIYIYRFDAQAGKLTPNSGQPFVALPSGDGPRHFAFHPNGKWLYSIQEEASTIVLFRYEPTTGSLESQQTISALPSGFAGSSFASEVLVSADGKFLYAANRLHDTIAAFSIDSNGTLRAIGESPALGDYPSQIQIDPTGKFLYACNKRSDSITCFRINRNTGLLKSTEQYTPAGSPGTIIFLA